MKIKNLLAIIAALTLTASSAAVYTAIAVGEPVKVTTTEPVTESVNGDSSGVYDEYTYSSWGDKAENVSMNLGRNGTFSCEWQDTELAKFSRGTDTFTSFYDGDNVTMNATASVNAEGSYFIGETFRYRDIDYQNRMVYLVMAYSDLDFLADYEPISENKNYIIYKVKHNIFDESDYNFCEQIFMVYKNGLGKREIDISKDITEDIRVIWEVSGDVEYVMSKPELCIYGFNGSGSAEVTKNDVTVTEYMNDVGFNKYTEYKRDSYTYSFMQSEGASGSVTVKKLGSVDFIWESDNEDDWAMMKKTVKYSDLPEAYKNGFFTVNCHPIVNLDGEYKIGSYLRTDNDIEIFAADCQKSLSRFADETPVAVINDKETGIEQYKVYIVDNGETKEYWLINTHRFKCGMNSGMINDEVNYILAQLRNNGIEAGDIVEAGAFAEVYGKGKGTLIFSSFNIGFKTQKEGCVQATNINTLQKYLLGEDVELEEGVNYDINFDGKINIYDLIEMRMERVELKKIGWGLQEEGGNDFPPGVKLNS